jgi:hypothetical protein
MRIFPKIPQTILTISLGVIAVLAIGYIVYQDQFARFDIQHLKADPKFKYSDTLSCRVIYSTYKDLGEHSMDYYKETNLQITGLNTDAPKLTIDGFDTPLAKLYDDASVVTLRTVSSFPNDASIQIIQILKDRGTFVSSIMNNKQYFGPREIFFPNLFQNIIAQKGRCE